MLKVLYFISETKKRFGVYKVADTLTKKQNKDLKIKLSYNIFDIFFFKPQIIHIHGCWRPTIFLAFLIAKLTAKKIVISPHGMIDPVSFNQKRIKKLFAWQLYQKYIFTFANLIIVNSQLEKNNLQKKLKIIKKIKIISHGVTLTNNSIIKKKKLKKINFVFYSRIHPSKNLIKLIKIWKSNYFFNKYRLDIYGEVVNIKYFRQIKNEILNSKNISYKGKITNNLNKKLSNYDIFLHPSKSENFGLVILEAMSCGLFPIVNKNLDWKILEKNKLGFSLNFTSQNLRIMILKLEKIKKYFRSNKFKKRLRLFLIKNYDWNLILKEYQFQYGNLISKD